MPGGAGIVAFVVAVAGGHAKRVRSLAMNREFVSVPRSTRNAVAPCVATIDRGHKGAGLDRDPQSFGLERMARDPAHMVRRRSGREGPFRRGRQRLQATRLLP